MRRDGFALLEVVVAFAILAVSGLALVEATAGALRDVGRARAREREIVDADRLLGAYLLLDRRDLDGSLGRHVAGPWRVEIELMDLALFRITIADSLGHPALATALYRPGTNDAF